ncbi:hypothetical protein B0J15DRAFT_390398 [Fusarium solani]|uniref:Rhodopsin domain-containing protein n=1 Tax=Fusarium solani TaxID=169388 RepID=A0A9P9KUE6_FUSSL|nr:uncharacterized protein B0J15DRAFT_390398 [Fusarium solani]KAH7268875.1 hypothetical protein B0J15DRAFT_390398 [Fusarium solani]
MQSRQPDLLCAEFITFPAATVFLLLRVISRKITRVGFWWDDWFAILCYTTAVAWAIMIPLWVERGFGLHATDVKGMSFEDANATTKKFLFFIEHIYAFTLFFAKISILTFYWRMFRVTNIKIAIKILLGCSVIWILARIQKLQLPGMQKLGIILMFMFGILVCIAGLVIVGVSTTFDNTSPDMTWNLAPIIIWATVEVNLVTISTCLPTIRPACIYIFTCTNPTSSLGSASNSYGQSYGRSQAKKSIRLSTLPKDESSSTHQLAGDEEGGSGSISSDFESHALDRHHGNIATVTVPNNNRTSGDHHNSGSFGGGIMVKNETVVRVSTAKPR